MLKAIDLFMTPNMLKAPQSQEEQIWEILESYQQNGFDCPKSIALDIYSNCLDWYQKQEISPSFLRDLQKFFEIHWFSMQKQKMSNN